jgi:MFS superfamily sulfate permease-like transporter
MRFPQPLLAATLLLLTSTNAVADFYRYQDENGQLVVAYRLTPEAIQQGYEVINSQGVVVAVVEPAKTKRDKDAENSAAEQRESAAEQREYDLRLLMTYGDADELKDAIERRESVLMDEIELIRSKLQDTRVNLRETEDRAGLEERQDGAVSEATDSALEQFRTQIASLSDEIVALEEAYATSQRENEVELARLKELLGE